MNQVHRAILDFETYRNASLKEKKELALVLSQDAAHIFFVQGLGLTLVQGQEVRNIPGGSMAILAKGSLLLPCLLQESTDLLVLRLNDDLLGSYPDLAIRGFSLLPQVPAMGEAMGNLLAAAPFPGIAGEYFRQAKIFELLAFALHCLGCPLRTQSQRSGQDCLLVQKARDIIEADLSRVPALARLARDLGTNESRLNACFRTVLGTTPYDYIKEKRLECARKLVAETGLAMGSIADRVGYTSQAHFSVLFLKETGMSPRAYRKLHQDTGGLQFTAPA